jgi:hypothetical protein
VTKGVTVTNCKHVEREENGRVWCTVCGKTLRYETKNKFVIKEDWDAYDKVEETDKDNPSLGSVD